MNNNNSLKNKRIQRQNSINLTVMQPTNNVFPPTRMHSISEDRLSQHSFQQKMRIQVPQQQSQQLHTVQQTQAFNQLLQQQPQQQQIQFLQHSRQKQQQQQQQQQQTQQQQNIIPYVTLQVQQGGKVVQTANTTTNHQPPQILQYQISNSNSSDSSNKPITQLLREHLSNNNRNNTILPTRQVSQTLQHQSSSNSNESFTSSSTEISQYMQQGIQTQQQSQQQPYATQISSSTVHLAQQNIAIEQKQPQQQQQQQQLIPQLKPLITNIQHQQLQQQTQSAFTQFRTTLLPNMVKQQQQQSTPNQQQQQQQQSQLKGIIDEPAVTLLPEICDIMRSFGDSDRPRGDSVRLVEQILKQQLRDMFHEASMVAMRRKGTACPSQADFEFLMRNKPIKIARMRKHLKDMRILKKFLSIRTGRPQDFAEELERHESDEELSMEVPELFDEERTRRLFRADRISQTLNGQQYIDFNEARKTSFYCRHGEKIKNKFRSFLKLPTDLRIPVSIMNILAYFAHETIAVIVDYAILTRLNTSNRKTEPFSRVTSAGASAAMLHICPEVTQGRGMEVHKAITVQEIQEGIRRFQQMTNKGIGYGRRYTNGLKQAFLAL